MYSVFVVTVKVNCGLVPRNALVLTDLAAFSVTGNPETDRLLSPNIRRELVNQMGYGLASKKGRCECAAAEALVSPALVVYLQSVIIKLLDSSMCSVLKEIW